MMEKTIPSTELKKTCLIEEMKKYQKYTGQCGGHGQRQENNEVVVRRRPKKTQKIRPKSEVREKTEEDSGVGRDRRRPLSYVEGTRGKDFYVQTCNKPVR